MDDFTRAYIATALWSSTDDEGEPLDGVHDESDIAPDTLAAMVADCASFQTTNAGLLADAIATGAVKCGPDFDEMGRAGHDFWLTRNRHGAGFWDGDWPEPYAKQLTDMAHAYGSVDLYVGDDGAIHA